MLKIMNSAVNNASTIAYLARSFTDLTPSIRLPFYPSIPYPLMWLLLALVAIPTINQ